MQKQSKFIEDVHSIYTTGETKAFQGFEIKEKLFHAQSPYQKIEIYENDSLGRILVLDDIVQITERDEFIYQEMMAHVPMLTHPNPKNILIIGGGDGGILREVLKYKNIDNAVMVEIDQIVIDACVEHMPSINNSGDIYNDKRTQLEVRDAFEYIVNTKNKFDVVIIDSTDPIGPGEKLFSKKFYTALEKTLNPGAIVVTQGGVPLFQPGEVANTLKCLREVKLATKVYVAAVPTYYGGYMTLGYGVKAKNAITPSLEKLKTLYEENNLLTKHYNPEVHLAAFALPKWIKDDIEQCI
jgi:spermidine synthase